MLRFENINFLYHSFLAYNVLVMSNSISINWENGKFWNTKLWYNNSTTVHWLFFWAVIHLSADLFMTIHSSTCKVSDSLHIMWEGVNIIHCQEKDFKGDICFKEGVKACILSTYMYIKRKEIYVICWRASIMVSDNKLSSLFRWSMVFTLGWWSIPIMRVYLFSKLWMFYMFVYLYISIIREYSFNMIRRLVSHTWKTLNTLFICKNADLFRSYLIV